MARVAILGAGVMGSAMTVPLAAAGHEIALVGTHLDEEIVRSVAADGVHPKLKVALPGRVTPHPWTAFAQTLDERTECIVLGVSSAGVEWAIDRLCEALPRPIPLLMVTKGMQPLGETLQSFPPFVAGSIEARTGHAVPVTAIGGPCIAGELAVERETSVVFAGEDEQAVARAIGLTEAPFYHARPSGDVVGTEVCAAFKNFYALAVGAAAGLLESSAPAANAAGMHNLSASLFAQAVAEMAILAEACGGRRESAFGLPGAGDLYVTCQAGRNSRMGRLLGLGLSYEEGKLGHMADDTVEGAELALTAGPTLRVMMAAGTLPAERLPLARAILDAICDDRPLILPWATFHRAEAGAA